MSVRPDQTPHPNSAAGGHPRDQLHQDVVVDRLDQVVVESRVCSSPPIVSLPPPGEGDQNGLHTWRASNALGRFIAVQHWKADVQQDHMRLEFSHEGDGFQSVVGRSDVMTNELEQHGHHVR